MRLTATRGASTRLRSGRLNPRAPLSFRIRLSWAPHYHHDATILNWYEFLHRSPVNAFNASLTCSMKAIKPRLVGTRLANARYCCKMDEIKVSRSVDQDGRYAARVFAISMGILFVIILALQAFSS